MRFNGGLTGATATPSKSRDSENSRRNAVNRSHWGCSLSRSRSHRRTCPHSIRYLLLIIPNSFFLTKRRNQSPFFFFFLFLLFVIILFLLFFCQTSPYLNAVHCHVFFIYRKATEKRSDDPSCSGGQTKTRGRHSARSAFWAGSGIIRVAERIGRRERSSIASHDGHSSR